MAKILTIKRVVAIVLMSVFFAIPVFFGIRGDKQIRRFLDSSSVIEKFENSADSKARVGEKRVSPLVQQAETFALYLNPEPKPKKALLASKSTSVTRELAVTPKIKVLGTCYCVDNPEMSLALIDEPGKGLHWVRQSGRVGHLQIEKIKNGLVIVKSSKETFELMVEKSTETSEQTAASLISAQATSEEPIKHTLPVLGETSSEVSK